MRFSRRVLLAFLSICAVIGHSASALAAGIYRCNLSVDDLRTNETEFETVDIDTAEAEVVVPFSAPHSHILFAFMKNPESGDWVLGIVDTDGPNSAGTAYPPNAAKMEIGLNLSNKMLYGARCFRWQE